MNTEFYIQTTGNNLNPGSTNSDSPAVTYTGGDWDATTDIYTAPSGADMTEAVADGTRFAALYVDGDTVPTHNQYLVARITAVNAGTRQITLSTTARTLLGTEVATGSANRSLRIGGAKKGPNGTSWHPFGLMSGALTDSTGNIVRVNVKTGSYALANGTVLTSVTGTAATDLLTTDGSLAPDTGTGFRIVFGAGFGGLTTYTENDANSSYYAIRISSTTFKAAATYLLAIAGTAINISSDGTGATVTPTPAGPTNSNAGSILWEGYTTTVGDGTRTMTRPNITGDISTLPFAGWTIAGTCHEVRYIQFSRNGIDSPGPNIHAPFMVATTGGGTSAVFFQCKWDHTWRNGLQLGGAAFYVRECEGNGCNVDSGHGFGQFSCTSSGTYSYVTAHHAYKVGDAGDPGFVHNSGPGIRVIYDHCIATHNGGAGLWTSSGAAVFTVKNCIFAYNGFPGAELLSVSGNSMQFENCLFISNGVVESEAGISYPASALYVARLTKCAFFGNGGGDIQNGIAAMEDKVTLTADPFENGATGDFRLNNVDGGGAECRNAGIGAFCFDTSATTAVAGAYSAAITSSNPSIGSVNALPGSVVFGGAGTVTFG